MQEKEGVKKNDEKILNDGTVQIKQGTIYIKDPKDGGEPAIIAPGKFCKIMVDGKEVKGKQAVLKHNKIEVIFDENIGKRNLNLSITSNSLEAYISISYEPGPVYGLKDKEESKFVVIDVEVKEKKYPPKFSKEEIQRELINRGIIYGLSLQEIIRCTAVESIKDLLIAKGKSPIESKDDRLELKFEKNRKFLEDDKGNIDYKSIGRIESVKPGDVLAIVEKGIEGQDGVNIFGKIIKTKKKKEVKIRCGNGCYIDGNMVKASIEGKPEFNGVTFEVSQIYEIKNDVDLSTGNIDFNGTVLVYGAVVEGMKVQGGKGVEVYKNVSGAEVISHGAIFIGGNALFSKVISGKEDTVNIRLRESLNLLSGILKEIRQSTAKIIDNNLLGRKARHGEIIKILIENKFSNITRVLFTIENSCMQRGLDPQYINALKENLLGRGPLEIEDYRELFNLEKLVKSQLSILEEDNIIPSDIEIKYSQDSIINSSGSIYITGKGEYVSNINAQEGIYFTGINSVARGGLLKSKKEIKCKYIGSIAGVPTRIEVEGNGHIWADIAYHNTRFKVGDLEHILEYPCKDVHVYLDSKGELVIDKLRL